MDEDLSIINTNTRNEKIKNFFINNRIKISSTVVILIIILIGTFSYDKYKDKVKKEISDNFNSITINYSEDTKEKTVNSLIEIISKKDPTYSPLSLYFIIDNNLIIDHEKVNSLFDIIIKDISLDNEIKNLVVFKKALYNADKVEEAEILKLLNPIINSESVWRTHALFLIGEFFYSKDQKKKSKEFFDLVISSEKLNPELQKRAQQRLNRDLSD